MLESQFRESKKTITEVANDESNSRIQGRFSLCRRRKRRCDRGGEEVVSGPQGGLRRSQNSPRPTGHERQPGRSLRRRRRKRLSTGRQRRDEADRGRASPWDGENRTRGPTGGFAEGKKGERTKQRTQAAVEKESRQRS